MADYCCPRMQENCEYECKQHAWPDCGDVIMRRIQSTVQGTWYGIPIHDGGSSLVSVRHCPWCGTMLDQESVGERMLPL